MHRADCAGAVTTEALPPSYPLILGGDAVAAVATGVPLVNEISLWPWPAVGAAALVAAGLIKSQITTTPRRLRWITRRMRVRLRWYPGPGFATRTKLYLHYGRRSARTVAKHGRKSLTWSDRHFGPWSEYATFHGRAQGWLHRWGVYTTFEDITITFAPPQEGKSLKAACSIVDAPGPTVVTSIRGDLIALTAALRQVKGRAWVWNPEGVGDYDSNMRWNLVEDCQDIVTAVRRAGHMVEASENKGLSDADFWADLASMTLAAMMHAAALVGANMITVYGWILDRSDEPLRVLAAHPHSDDSALTQVNAFLQLGTKTRDGVVTTLSRVLRFMTHPSVVDALCPVAGPGFNFERFLRSKDTLYLVSGTSQGSPVAPLFSAMLAELVEQATRLGSKTIRADGQKVSRLDPPLSLELDEAANTSPVPVDRWASWAAGSGIRIHLYFQSYAQIIKRWGAEGAKALLAAAKCKIVSSSVGEGELLDLMSHLLGKVTVRDRDRRIREDDGRTRYEPQYDDVDIIPPSDIRKLPPGHALLVSTSADPTIIRMANIRTRRDYRLWVKSGAGIRGLRPVLPRPIPAAMPELLHKIRFEMERQLDPHQVPPPSPDEITGRPARRNPYDRPRPLPSPPPETRPMPPLPQEWNPWHDTGEHDE
ncbi:hypothetical protein Pta02_77510 [Planobispora takensis]|uniref:TraD/TraG TraM recognition site domain-containing protein n=2 Tax=Planobispora takensis TaxID=1367882 RepID=A0A8J3T4U7_9ACTN|nr:hypothetical protein Pta02_77510 [Planobispora takensis]